MQHVHHASRWVEFDVRQVLRYVGVVVYGEGSLYIQVVVEENQLGCSIRNVIMVYPYSILRVKTKAGWLDVT